MKSRTPGFWFLQVPGWLFAAWLIYGQGIPAFDYELGVRMGTQDPVERVTAVGVAFWKGFAIADAVFYIPLLVAGLIGVWLGKNWGRLLGVAALGITVYWPIVVLVAAVEARNAPGWSLDEGPYWIVLPAIVLWALWGLWWLCVSASPRQNS